MSFLLVPRSFDKGDNTNKKTPNLSAGRFQYQIRVTLFSFRGPGVIFCIGIHVNAII
jgi:hypothetical protein